MNGFDLEAAFIAIAMAGLGAFTVLFATLSIYLISKAKHGIHVFRNPTEKPARPKLRLVKHKDK